MDGNTVSPYGTWKSPITSDLIVSGAVKLGQVAVDGKDVYWLEGRPAEGGRNVIVRQTPDGRTIDVTPPPFNARTKVHEYGGGDFLVDRGIVYFSNFADQRLYRQEQGSEPRPITPEGKLYYCDGVFDTWRDRLICVREDHEAGDGEPENTLVSIDPAGDQDARILASGSDFYSTPRLSPDGSRLAWLSWNHPNMPWDGTELMVAEVQADGTLGTAVLVAGGPDESIFQPEWSPDGTLYFISDRNSWWNLYRWSDGTVESVLELDAEIGVPQWVFGLSTFAFESSDKILCAIGRQGLWQVERLETKTGRLCPIETTYTEIQYIKAAGRSLILHAGSFTGAAAIVQIDLDTEEAQVLRRSVEVAVESEYISSPLHIEFPTENGLTAHAFFYPPRNRDFAAPPGELPPLLVKSHGGPTSAASTALSLQTQYWTSRGIAVLNVNYGGSTGYGRDYRRRLDGQWGIVDVDDCVNGAKFLVEQGLVDGDRLMISGGSAGGFTTLAALTFRQTFKAGASHYGVGDLEALALDTHKFESRYLDRLIGPYPGRRDIYLARSPIHSTDRLSCPVILFQGLDDRIVPPNQAEMMVEALRSRGLPFAYVTFAGEGHGFRKSANIKRALDGELYFYSKIFGFALADPIEPVPIENLE